MRVFIISDMEGVNGVLNLHDWCLPDGFRNSAGCRLLTEEVNAAVRGFFAGGAADVIVYDGHGASGSILCEMLDSRASLQRGRMDFPVMNDQVDALAFVGQHAKAGTANAHLAHTQTEEAIDFQINGVSLGEFGQSTYAFNEINVPAIFAAGDLALTLEAQAIMPEIVTVAVKEGFNTPVSEDCPADDVFLRESAALHYPRAGVLAEIEEKARVSAEKFLKTPEVFAIKPLPGTQYIAEAAYRKTSRRIAAEVGEYPARSIKTTCCTTVRAALKEFYTRREWCMIDGEFIKELKKNLYNKE